MALMSFNDPTASPVISTHGKWAQEAYLRSALRLDFFFLVMLQAWFLFCFCWFWMNPRLHCALESVDGDFCEDPASNPSRETLLVRALPVLGHPSSSPCTVCHWGSSKQLLLFPKHLPLSPAFPWHAALR